MPFEWGLPPSASSYAGEIDRIYYMILIVTGLAFVIVEATLVWFMIKYRGRPGRKAYYTHGSVKAEVIWTAVPAVVVVVIGILSGGVWNEIRGRDSVPPDAMPVALAAKQFEWNATYAGADGQLGTDDDFTTRNIVQVPVNRPVVVHLSSEDVIHSFFVPAFRVKHDAVPGMVARVWFEATQTGEFDIACAELCGLGHYRMGGRVVVQEQAEYERWLAEQAANQTVASR
jgi:cytochrome c oxidase subunit 2